MEVFDGFPLVRLESVARPGQYLAADVDGYSVIATDQRRTHNTVWAVQGVEAFDGTRCVALRGCYGRYLFAGPMSGEIGNSQDRTIRQASLDDVTPQRGFLWQAAAWEASIVLRSATGRYLSPDGPRSKSRACRFAAADHYVRSKMILWDIENVPVLADSSSIPDAGPQIVHSSVGPPSAKKVTRRLSYIVAEGDGGFDEARSKKLILSSNELEEVWKELKKPENGALIRKSSTLCLRAGRCGMLTPLLIDLPVGNDPLDAVILPRGTAAEQELLYPAEAEDMAGWRGESASSGPPGDLLGALPAGPPEPRSSRARPMDTSRMIE
ncbi:hypothetical protein ACP4OV_015821 [Aristida adscensionis]